VERDRRAEVVVLNGFSAHADQRDLVHYAEKCRERGPVTQVVLVHGDPKPQQILADILHVKGFKSITTPAPQDRLTII
jgi:metallo-beta-lactamase family protein